MVVNPCRGLKLLCDSTRCFIVYGIPGSKKHPLKTTKRRLFKDFLVHLWPVVLENRGKRPPTVNHRYTNLINLQHRGQNSLERDEIINVAAVEQTLLLSTDSDA